MSAQAVEADYKTVELDIKPAQLEDALFWL